VIPQPVSLEFHHGVAERSPEWVISGRIWVLFLPKFTQMGDVQPLWTADAAGKAAGSGERRRTHVSPCVPVPAREKQNAKATTAPPFAPQNITQQGERYLAICQPLMLLSSTFCRNIEKPDHGGWAQSL
jgi:hypothetical protein